MFFYFRYDDITDFSRSDFGSNFFDELSRFEEPEEPDDFAGVRVSQRTPKRARLTSSSSSREAWERLRPRCVGMSMANETRDWVRSLLPLESAETRDALPLI